MSQNEKQMIERDSLSNGMKNWKDMANPDNTLLWDHTSIFSTSISDSVSFLYLQITDSFFQNGVKCSYWDTKISWPPYFSASNQLIRKLYHKLSERKSNGVNLSQPSTHPSNNYSHIKPHCKEMVP